MSSNIADIQAKTLDFVQGASELNLLIEKQAKAGLARTEKVRPLTEKVGDALLKGNLIKEDELNEALKLASTHEGALQLVLNLGRYLKEAEQAHKAQLAQGKLGQGIPTGNRTTKKASYESTESPFVGARAGQGERRASDVALFSKLGISFPQAAASSNS